MKKLLIALALLLALPLVSCVTGHSDDNDNQRDSVPIEIDSATIEQQVTGVAIDGAMNSIFVKVGDDTLLFNYPDLDSDHRGAWAINDTVTVRYYVTENGDSVTDLTVGSVS